MTTSSTPAEQAISLPKGGGAIRGIGETFKSDLFTGTANLVIPIALSPGRDGFGPSLALEYSSANGNGPFGIGWELSVPRIARRTEKGLPRYDETDVFVLSGAEDLVPVPGDPLQRDGYTISRYRPRTENQFARIERWQHASTADVHWRLISRDDVTSLYGTSLASRVADPEDPTRVYEWLLDETFDAYGNRIVYDYAADEPGAAPDAIYEQNRQATQRYLRRICYGNLPEPLLDAEDNPLTYPDGTAIGCERGGRRYAFEAVLDYGDWPLPTREPHPLPPAAGTQELFGPDPSRSTAPNAVPVRDDVFSTFRARFDVRTLRRCRRVLMFHHFAELERPTLVRSTDFDYVSDPDTSVSFLSAVTVTGYRRGADGQYVSARMPPVSFEYSQFRPHEQRYRSLAAAADDLPPAGLDDPQMALVDLFGGGLPDVVEGSAAGFRYWRNLGGGLLDRPRSMPQVPSGVALSQPGVGFGDMGGDGCADLLVHSGPLQGFFESGSSGTWKTFRAYAAAPTFDLADPNVRLLDLTGDGLTDALMTSGEHFLWFRCLGEDGFAPPEAVARQHDPDLFPDVFFGDSTARVRLAPISGGALNDIVFVHNNRVDYWPNLGYGCFGRRVTMANAPNFGDDFDPRRLFLADLNGTGCADLVYVDNDRVHFWFNQCGNAWSDRETIHGTPAVTNLDSVRFADVFGTGTATLVWSYAFGVHPEGNYKALDFCGGVKPYVLTTISNNMGASTRVSYAPSTRYFLEDLANGTTWATRLPFPVQVVDKVEVIDLVSRTKLVKTYKYHHGYFDGRDREFRGFGRVDQLDTETFEDFSRDGLHDARAELDAGAATYHAPPIETRTWFHTGIYFDEDVTPDVDGAFDYRELTNHFRREFYRGDEAAAPLDEHVVETGATPHDAYRTLRGAVLRTETYGRDGSDRAPHPYQVVESRYKVAELQAQGENQHGVYAVHPLETLVYRYERNPADPRISHALTLEVDAFLDPLQTLAVGYGRRQPDADLPTQSDRDAQTRTSITYALHRYTNPIDSPALGDRYRAPLAAESLTFELTGFNPVGGPRFTLEEWVANDFERLRGATPIGYEEAPDPAREQRRLVEHTRTLYRRDDLSAPLAVGELQSLALPFESYKLAFTPGLVNVVFRRDGEALVPDPADVLGGGADKGGYVDLDGDGNWWVPSGRMFFSPGSGDTPAAELDYARRHFFRPRRHRDPFHTDAVSTERLVLFDAYDLLIRETVDPLGNRVTAGERLPSGQIDPAAPGIDYRMLQPVRLMDQNGNRSAVAVDALGFVVGTAAMGKPGESVGDSLESFETDLDQPTLLSFLEQPLPPSQQALLAGATTRLIYDLFAYQRTQHETVPQPPVVCTLARETHVSALAPGEQTRIQCTFTYSDGFGREVQKKLPAPPGPVPARDGAGQVILEGSGQPVMTAQSVSPRWIGTGWTVFDNKGAPVRRFDPFFSDTHHFERDVRVGASALLFYDPVGRAIGTLHADHSWEKVRFDPWRQEIWDRNDTVLIADPAADADVGDHFSRLPASEYLPTWYALRTDPANASAASERWPDPAVLRAEQDAAAQAAMHAATPTVLHADALGRAVLSVAHNRFKYSGDPSSDPPTEERYLTRSVFDVEGNLLEIVDALDRVVERSHYDMLRNRIQRASMDAGDRWILNDVAGKPLYAWDSRGRRFRTIYDPLRRATDSLLRDGAAAEAVVGSSRYGENHPALPNPGARNARGKLVELRDQAGVVLTDEYDFKGNPLVARRQLATEYKQTLDWGAPVPLDPEQHTGRNDFDALNRPTERVSPDGSIQRSRYNETGLLEAVDVRLPGAAAATAFVTRIDYDANGQRELISYGSGATTRYTYDPATLRLLRLLTTRPPGGNGFATQVFDDAATVQDLSYTYDPAGNVTRIADSALRTLFWSNAQVEPVNRYTCDATYRLIEAYGRESVGQSALSLGSQQSTYRDYPFAGQQAQPLDLQAVRAYTEQYHYDAAGNLQRALHQADGGAWEREYRYQAPSLLDPSAVGNRVSASVLHPDNAAIVESYDYDAHGNTTAMPHLTLMEWDYKDQLRASARQVVNDGTPQTTWYVYDSTGQRVRKITERQNGTRKNERLYLGAFERYREYAGGDGSVTLERESLHVTDDSRRIAIVETRTQGSDGSAAQRVRYQLANHLQSASVELDDAAQLVSYEEYLPYGGTSYQVTAAEVSAKRYRYAGMERDEETGLSYHGARYYAPWLARWVSADPIGTADDLNLYAMARGNPVRRVDLSGKDNTETTYVTPRVRADLKKGNVKYAEQVNFELLDASGKVKATGRFDLVFRDPRPGAKGRLIIPELKGKNINELHSNQFDYLPELESKGGTIRIRSMKTSNIDLAKNQIVTLKPDDFFRVGVENLEDFSSALREVAGGKPITNKFVGRNGEVRLFTSEAEAHEFFRSQGIEPTPTKPTTQTAPTTKPVQTTPKQTTTPEVTTTPLEGPGTPRPIKMYGAAPGGMVLDPAPSGVKGGAVALLVTIGPDLAQTIARKAGASETVTEHVGFWSSVGTGALAGGIAGAPEGGIGAVPGAIIGGTIGGIGYLSRNYEFCVPFYNCSD